MAEVREGEVYRDKIAGILYEILCIATDYEGGARRVIFLSSTGHCAAQCELESKFLVYFQLVGNFDDLRDQKRDQTNEQDL